MATKSALSAFNDIMNSINLYYYGPEDVKIIKRACEAFDDSKQAKSATKRVLKKDGSSK